jgi:hypothetical protein
MKRFVSQCSFLLLGAGLAMVSFTGCGAKKAALPAPIEVTLPAEFPSVMDERSVRRLEGNAYDSSAGQRTPYAFRGELNCRAVIEARALVIYLGESIEVQTGGNIFRREQRVRITESGLDLAQCEPRERYALRIMGRGQIVEVPLADPALTGEGLVFEQAVERIEEIPRFPKYRDEPLVLAPTSGATARMLAEWRFFECEPNDPGAVPRTHAKLKPLEWNISVIPMPTDRPLENARSQEPEREGGGTELNKGRWISHPKR